MGNPDTAHLHPPVNTALSLTKLSIEDNMYGTCT